MTVDDVMSERAKLIGWEFSHGLTADEAARLEWLNTEARRLCPRVTPAMRKQMADVEAGQKQRQQRIEELRARLKTPNV